MKRRSLLGALGFGGLVSLGFARDARATLVRGLSLEELAAGSTRILRARALDSTSHWVVVGGRRRIVTDTRVLVEDVIAKDAPSDRELLVRTLGGTVGDVGALVHGEAELTYDEPCLVFLKALPEGLHRVNGMAQGHYPLVLDNRKVPRLRPSPRSSEVLGADRSAIARLVGRDLPEARALIHEALRR